MDYDTPGCVYLHSAFMAHSTLGCRELLMAPESTASNFLPLKTVTISGDDYRLDSVLFFLCIAYLRLFKIVHDITGQGDVVSEQNHDNFFISE